MKRQHAILTLIVAVMAVLTAGCQKDEEYVTLVAEIQERMSGNGKVYIDEHTPCWQNGDEVFINNAVYPVTAASGAIARIENVASAHTYQAIFPAGIVSESSQSSDNSITVTLPSMQTYRIANDRQQLDLPMGARLTSGNTLRFYSLCSIVRVTIHNQLNHELPLGRIKLKARIAKLSGSSTATVSRNAFDSISMSNSAQNNVRLDFTPACPATVEAQGTGTFDIVVPPFTTDDVTLTLYTPDGYMCEVVMEGMSLARNSIASVTLDVTALTEAPAELISGPAFNAAIPKRKNVSTVLFEYNSPVSSGTLLSTPDSPVPIYGNLDGTTWRVSTRASQIQANPNCSHMFESAYGFYYENPHERAYYEDLKLKRIVYGDRFRTDYVTDMSHMFEGSGELTTIRLSNFNTSNVTDMSWMFAGCTGLQIINVSNFNTEKVTDMSGMFYDCISLKNLNLSSFNTSNVTNMRAMFTFYQLSTLDLSNFDTRKVTNMESMFSCCDYLTNLDISSFNTSNVTDMCYMFERCSSLTSLDLSNFNTSNVTGMRNMFEACRNLKRLNLSNFNTSKVTSMNSMFLECNTLTSLNISNFNTSRVTNMEMMFCKCYKLTDLDLSSFNTSRVIEMSKMFMQCTHLTNLNLSHFDMSGIPSEGWKFAMCSSLATSSGACTIICPTAVRTALEHGTDLPTSGVVFTWVTP